MRVGEAEERKPEERKPEERMSEERMSEKSRKNLMVSLSNHALLLLLVIGCPSSAPVIDPSLEGDGHYLAGTSAYLKGDFETAHREFDEVKRVNPGDRRLPAAMGELFVSEGKTPEAIQAFEEASRLDPKRATTWSRLAALYSLKNENDLARQAVQKALLLNPHDFDALEVAGTVAFKTGNLDEAVRTWSLASESAPEAARVALVQKSTAALMKAGRPRDALSVLQRAKTFGIVSGDLDSERGDRLVEIGRPAEAIEAYSDAARLNTSDPTLWELVGELEAKQGRDDKAAAAYRESLKVKDRGVVHVGLARLCQKTKDAACVKEQLDAALQTASGEELRETLDLTDLLVAVGRKHDALMLLAAVSAEPEQRTNFALHLRVARLAKELKEKAVMKSACERVPAGPAKCP